MTIETDTRDRTIKLEADVEHLTEKVAEVSQKVNEMHALLLQALYFFCRNARKYGT